MAEHAEPGQLADPVEPAEADRKSPVRQVLSRIPIVFATGLALLIAVGALAGWFGWRSHQDQAAQSLNGLYVQTARQAAINLTTIKYTDADADIQRILDSTTGAFRADFQRRSQPFVDVVKQARSKSEGTVTAAGLESVTGDQAQVLLAVSVRTSMAEGPPGPPRAWRMRISVEKVGDGAKIANVQFVP